MLNKIKSTEEYFENKLRATLKMEQTVLGLLEHFADAAPSPDLEGHLRGDAEETKRHTRALQRVFSKVGLDLQATSAPAAEALDEESRQMLNESEEPILEGVIVSGAVEAEAHEIAVYEGLIAQADTLGHRNVNGPLAETLRAKRRMRKQMTARLRPALAATAEATRERKGACPPAEASVTTASMSPARDRFPSVRRAAEKVRDRAGMSRAGSSSHPLAEPEPRS
jgi:ferritin-like metal-binding protein YciE